MNMDTVVSIIMDPVVLKALAGLGLYLAVKTGVLSAAAATKADTLLNDGHTVSEVTDKTRLVATEVQKIVEQKKVGDSTRKKVWRGARAALWGIIGK